MTIRGADAGDCTLLADLVRTSHQDVAVTFGLSAANCPKHPSFCTEDWIRADLARGERYFILEVSAVPVGCVAYDPQGAGLAYLNRLSVLPAHRRCGIGARLVQHIIAVARREGVETLSIGVIGEHHDLQRWYRKLGFTDGDTRRFPHLPFAVRYMAYHL